MTTRRFEILDRKWEYMWDVPGTIAYWQECDARLAASNHVNARRERINNKLFYPCLKHFGFEPVDGIQVQQQVESGIQLAVEYFDDNWWRTGVVNDAALSQDEFELRQANTLRLDKSGQRQYLSWFLAYTAGLLLGGLSGKWTAVAQISSWFDAQIGPEYVAGEFEDEVMLLFVCIAGSLSPQPMDGADSLLAKVKKCRTKRPRLLCDAWEAANAGDQVAFNKAFKETVTHFLTKPENGQIHDYWIARHQSAIWLIAEQRGLSFPPLSDKHRAVILTRDSSGMI